MPSKESVGSMKLSWQKSENNVDILKIILRLLGYNLEDYCAVILRELCSNLKIIVH